MTLIRAGRDFLTEWQHSPWLLGALIRAPDTIIVQTVYELPRALQEHLAQWQGWRVEFRVVGRVCGE